MTEQQKKEIAVFRFGVIGEFVTGAELDYGEKERLLQQKCARKWSIPYSGRTRLSRSTILGWTRQYNGRIESLYPKNRSDQGKSRSFDDETASLIIKMRLDKPDATVDTLIVKCQLLCPVRVNYLGRFFPY
jgi:hypothetical protein